jgi:hypothetical protein
LSSNAPDYAAIKQQYVNRFPTAAPMFGFADFSLWELRFEEAHLVLGFGQAFMSTAVDPLVWLHQKPDRPLGKQSRVDAG